MFFRLVASISGKGSTPVATLFSTKPSEQTLDEAFFGGLAEELIHKPDLYRKEFEDRTKY